MLTKAKCIVDYLHFTKTLRGVARNQKVSKSSVQRWIKSDEVARSVMHKRVKKVKRGKAMLRQDIKHCIEKTIDDFPFITMNDLSHLIQAKCGVKRSGRTVNRYALQAGFTYKKAIHVVDADHDNVHVRRFCTQFEDAYQRGQLYCIDEAGFYVGDHPRKGRSKKGKRLAIGSGRTMRKSKFTLIMAIGVNGIAHFQILDHNCKKSDFIEFYSKMDLPRGSVVLMDNLRCHHSREIETISMERELARLFTPTYSPRCNPIEKIFGILKPLYRKRCPAIDSLNKEPFRQVFEGILHEQQGITFIKTFENTLSFLKQTIETIDANPLFKFIGYDISSFVRLNNSGPQ